MTLTLRQRRELQRLAPKTEVVVESDWFKRGDWKPVTRADYNPGSQCTPASDAAIERRLKGGAA